MTTKQRKRDILEGNIIRGKIAENWNRANDELDGCRTERTGRDSDYKRSKRDIWADEEREELVEVKSGNAKTSELQEETRRKNKNYKVERCEVLVW